MTHRKRAVRRRRSLAGNGRARGAVALTAGAPAAVLGVAVGYLSVLTAAGWLARAMRRDRTVLPPAPRHRFTVLIPAHNEERLISDTLKSLAQLDYPQDLVSVHVAADHCTDATAAVARAHGAFVHEHDDPAPAGKGPALQWVLHRLSQQGELGDAVMFIDADTTVSHDFLRIVDAHLVAGAPVVQAHYGVRDPEQAPAIAFRSAALAARHYLRPLGRTWLGGSAGLYGNGMVFRTEVLDGRRWSDHLTEDCELHLELLLDGVRVAFAADAVIHAEMPATLRAARTQHERWERGRLQIARRFLPPLAKRAVTGGPAGRFAYADAAVEQVIPPFSVLVFATAGLTAASVVRTLWRPSSAAARRSVLVAGGLAAAEAAYALSALRMVDAPAAVYRSLLRSPRFVAWKVGLWLRTVTRPRDVRWVRTARNREGAAA